MSKASIESTQDRLYSEASSQYGAALQRLAMGYEMDTERRRDLLQEIHLALWKSLKTFDGRRSLRTWVYRVGHNVAVNHVIRDQRNQSRLQLGLDEMESEPQAWATDEAVDSELAFERLIRLIHRLGMPDRQIMLLYLDDVDARTIAEITGTSSGNVAVRIHRIKKLLIDRFQSREKDDA